MAEFHLPLYADALTDGIGIVSLSGQIFAANDALARMLDYPSKHELRAGADGGCIFLRRPTARRWRSSRTCPTAS